MVAACTTVPLILVCMYVPTLLVVIPVFLGTGDICIQRSGFACVQGPVSILICSVSEA